MWILSRLTFRIFAFFFFTLILFVAVILIFPKLDSRNLSALSYDERLNGETIAHNIQLELNRYKEKDIRWWLRFISALEHNTEPGQHLFVTTPEGQLISSYKPNPIMVNNFVEIANNVNRPVKKMYENREFIGPFRVTHSDINYKLYIIQPTKNLQSQSINLLFDHPVLLLFAVMIISAPLLLWLSWSLAKPARQLKYAADEVARGNFQEWPELESSTTEFRAVGVSFNHMLREINKMITLQQRLLSDISHELRTPLTRLKLATALLRRKYNINSSEIERIEGEANKLEFMIKDLLSAARNQHENNFLNDALNIDELWLEVLDDAKFEAEQLDKSLEINNIPTKGVILGNAATLNSALENIIRNAFRYAHSKIKITFEEKANNLLIIVDDDGPGVTNNEYEQIFRPFYRTSEARDRESGGSGLGLTIVKNAIIQHHGTVNASKSPLGGLQIIIELPLEKEKTNS